MRVRRLHLQPYFPVWENMKNFTIERNDDTEDELWILEHHPVYTQGQAGKPEHLLRAEGIPLVQSDRGGQITYHGPGQLVAYVLMNIQRRNLGVRTLVCKLEKILLNVLENYQIEGHTKEGAPGIYVEQKKIASIGLRVKNGCTYHGIALNVNMDLHPFKGINPCGFTDMEMTQMLEYQSNITVEQVIEPFTEIFLSHFASQQLSCFGA